MVQEKRTLFPMSRKTPAKQEGRHHRRKERVTEGEGRSRSGAAVPDWGAERKQNTPPATPLRGPDCSPGTAEAGRLRSTSCPRVLAKSTVPRLSPQDTCYLGSELDL